LITIARNEKLRRLVSTILAENNEMRAICQKLGFRMKADMDEGTVAAVLEL
jgi:L-amino acid N-acyltransferase YncA